MARKRYHHGDLRNALIEAGVRLLRTEGVEGLTLRRAAREAGVSHAAPAHHFGDRRGLLAAIAREGFVLLLDHMRRVPPDAAPRDRLSAVGRGYIAFALSHPHHFRVMFHPSLAERSDFPELERAGQQTFAHVVESIRDAQGAGVVRPGDPQQLAVLAWSTVHGASVLAIDRMLALKGVPTLDAEGLASRLTTDLFLGLRPLDGLPEG